MTKLSLILPWYRKLNAFIAAFRYNRPLFSVPTCEVVIPMDEPSEELALKQIVEQEIGTRFRIIVNDNEHAWRPPCCAINVGLRHAEGEWVAVLSPETVVGVRDTLYLLRRIAGTDKCFYTGHLRFAPAQCVESSFTPDNTEGYGFIMASKAAFECAGGYDERRKKWGGDDDDLQMRLSTAGWTKRVDPGIKLIHLSHAQSYTEKKVAQEPFGGPLPGSDWGRSFSRVAWDWKTQSS